MDINEKSALRKKIRTALIITIAGLVGSGISSFPLQSELNLALQFQQVLPEFFVNWFVKVKEAISYTCEHYPLMLYGYDWLGFAHFLIALAFVGPLRDPIKNQWVVQWGMMVSVLTILIALIAERFRDIPFSWSLIDASIGIGAYIILWLCNKWINQLKEQ